MIEQLAKAIHARNDHGSTWNDLDIYSKNEYREDARAAIEAMREPTSEMFETAAYYLGGSDRVRAVWYDLIDAMLEKDEE